MKAVTDSHKSNPFSVPQGYVDSYSTLTWVMSEAVTGVQGYADAGYYDTGWLTGLWSTPAKVEGIGAEGCMALG